MHPRAARRLQAGVVRAEQNRAGSGEATSAAKEANAALENRAQRVGNEPTAAFKEAKGAVDDAQHAFVPNVTPVPGLPENWNQAVPNGGRSPTEVTKPEGYGAGEAMSFSGPGPEIINGRLAMIGFTTAIAGELATGRPLLQQFQQASGPVVAIAILFAVASLVPMFRGADLKEENGPFTKKAELWNGRAAMIGFSALIITEWIKGGALL